MAKKKQAGPIRARAGARGTPRKRRAPDPVPMVRVYRGGRLVEVPKSEIEAEERAERERLSGSTAKDALFQCERADPETMVALARLAQTTVADLGNRRHGKEDVDPACPVQLDVGRKRCWDCPVWDRLGTTPFD